jgi:hypothetical protein
LNSTITTIMIQLETAVIIPNKARPTKAATMMLVMVLASAKRQNNNPTRAAQKTRERQLARKGVAAENGGPCRRKTAVAGHRIDAAVKTGAKMMNVPLMA